MKAIICRMCSSHDVINKDGVFVCQRCGATYSADEAIGLVCDIDDPAGTSASLVDDFFDPDKIIKTERPNTYGGDNRQAAYGSASAHDRDPEDDTSDEPHFRYGYINSAGKFVETTKDDILIGHAGDGAPIGYLDEDGQFVEITNRDAWLNTGSDAGQPTGAGQSSGGSCFGTIIGIIVVIAVIVLLVEHCS